MNGAPSHRIVGDARVPPWAAGVDVARALDEATIGDVVFVQRRRDGVVLVAVLPVSALAPELRELLERRRASSDLGALWGYVFRRWILALDVDGTAAVVEAMGATGRGQS